jgi:hypothetical protein
MHAPFATPLLALVLLASGAIAQTTWIVDRLNAPGTDFTDLPAAVAASSPGDVLRVRYVNPLVAAYTAPTISHGLTLLGEGAGPGLVGLLQIQNLPAGHQVVLRDLQLAPFVGGNPLLSNCSLRVWNNLGTVHLQNVDRATLPTSSSTLNEWRIESSRLVTLANCSVDMVGPTGTLRIKNTPLVSMHACLLQHAAVTAQPTLSVENSQLTLSETFVVGSGQASGAAAIEVVNATVRLAGAGTAIVNTLGGAAVHSPSQGGTLVVGSGAFVGLVTGVNLAQQPVPSLGGRINSTNLLQLTMFGEAFGIGVLAVGEPVPGPVPLWGGSLYLDPVQSGTVDVLAFDLGGRGQWQLQLPAALPAGFHAWMQGVTLGLSSGFLLTPPIVVSAP